VPSPAARLTGLFPGFKLPKQSKTWEPVRLACQPGSSCRWRGILMGVHNRGVPNILHPFPANNPRTWNVSSIDAGNRSGIDWSEALRLICVRYRRAKEGKHGAQNCI